MTNLTPADQWDGIYQLEEDDPVQGGVGGVSNLPLQNLTNRTERIHQSLLDVGIDIVNKVYSNPTTTDIGPVRKATDLEIQNGSSVANAFIDPEQFKKYNGVVETISDLRLREGYDDETIYLKCHTSNGDGGQGTFYWDATSTAADDNGVTIAVTAVATGRWIRQLNGFVTPEMFGARTNGVDDDAEAIDDAVNYLHSVGGGVLYCSAKTYLLAQTSTRTTRPFYVLMRDNVSITGAGIDATVFKVKDGENLRFRGTTGPFVFATNQETPLKSCNFSFFTVDWNGANNLLIAPGTGSPVETARNNASIFSLRGGIDILCDSVKIKETPGDQCIFFPAQSNLGQRNIVVRNCIFENNASAIPDNYNVDHSSIYCNGDYLLYENNLFINDNYPTGSMACYEIHGSHSIARNNKSNRYVRAFWVASDFESIEEITVDGDEHRDIVVAFSITAQAHAVNGVEIKNSTFKQRSGIASPTVFFINGNTIVECDKLKISGCTFKGAGYAQAFVQIQRIASLHFINNKVSGFDNYGLLSANLAVPSGNVIDSLIVLGNEWNDVKRPIYFNSPTLAAGSVMIQNDLYLRSVVDANAVITTAFSASKGLVSQNVFDPNYTKRYSGVSNGLAFDEPAVSGSWTVSVYDAATGGNVSPSTFTGYYNKKGQEVTITLVLGQIDTTGLTAGNPVYFNLPFPIRGTGTFIGAVQPYNVAFTGYTGLTVYGTPNASRVYFRAYGPGVAGANVNVSMLTSGVSSVALTMTYFTL